MMTQPNIVLILADDMGFSDLGCYGSEIDTPNIDSLARDGLRFSQMYNMARCCPTRASLLTGLYPHQAGVGHMVGDYGVPEYQGYLNQNCATIAEVLKGSGYRTQLSGKWHVGGSYPLHDLGSITPGDDKHPTPLQRGFDHFWGTLTGGGSFFAPPTLMDGETPITIDREDFYYTDEIAKHAARMIEESAAEDSPFFSYVAFTSPHWPLHAPEETIEKYRGVYDGGWDELRRERHARLKELGILDESWEIAPRDRDSIPWEDAENKEWESLRMAVYAAQIDRMDQGVGRVLDALDATGIRDNTLVIFLSDNGGCAEFLAEDTSKPEPMEFDTPMWNGERMRMGNLPEIDPGPADTFQSYDLPWANASNTPFRLHKRWVHEGGISTPAIFNWPEKTKSSLLVHEPTHIVDIAATIYDVTQTEYPTELNGNDLTPLEGHSFRRAIENGGWVRPAPIFWEHEGNRAVRLGDWKLVSEGNTVWELYNMKNDRTELNDLSGEQPEILNRMIQMYENWAERVGALPWPVIPEITASPRVGATHIHDVG
jgi:arylsulfatase A-like enzyme